MARAAHSPEVRAAVIAALLAGQSVSQVAAQYKLPKGTVSAWKNRRNAAVVQDATQKDLNGKSIGELLVELVRENLKGLIAGASLLQDAKWMREQGAAEIGTLLGITHDKTVRMLEAMGESQSETPSANEVSAEASPAPIAEALSE